ncbi:hypothetical protein A6A25_06815 [Saccharothrix sp. CB00851]|nr:hypothetical protein A6A25_06815 [Saccharothrix sp. CB00851]
MALAEAAETARWVDLCLHELVRRSTDRVPDAVALSHRGSAVTYRELEARANRLARLLVRRGVRPGDRVGVCLPRDPRLVVALLAVLNAGGCYVPLDPAYPAERLRFIAEDADTRLVLTDRDHRDRLPASAALCWEDLRLAEFPATRPRVAVTPRHLAYLIYTSGSTGRPKGVCVEHRSAARLLEWVAATFGEEELGGVLAATSVCFDLSIFEIFGPLATGGRFVLVDDVLALASLDGAAGVRLVNTVPSAMRELIAAGAVPAGVRTVCLAGEPLTADLARRAWELPGLRRLLNLYGPSEDTTYSTWADIARGDGGPPPIGVPLPGTRAYVLDATLAPTPPGAAGELYLAGDGLARGYHDRPAETAARFLPDPWFPGRMYRTGDRVRRRADGRLEFLGRLDDQVKLRGHRIEPGEVAAALEELPGVVAAAAAVATGPSGAPRLVGYLVGNGEVDAVAALRRRLPDFLVPGEVVWLARLPRTPSGKVDRAALPPPPRARSDWSALPSSLPPADGIERDIAAVWAEVLGVEVGRDDDFFALGGESLLATSVSARLRVSLGLPVTIRAIFDHPTVADLAAHTATLRPAADAVPRAVGRDGPLSPAQRRMWFLHRMDPGDTSYLLSFLIRCGPGVDPDRLGGAVRAVVAAHEALRTSFTLADEEPVQRVHPHVPLVVRRTESTGPDHDAELVRLARQDAARPMDLERAPLVRCRVVTANREAVAIVLTAHHIVFDGWSLEILVRDLAHYYAEPDPAPAARPGPALFAARQLAWLDSDAGRAATTALANSVRGAPDLLALPTDLPRPPVRGSGGGRVERALPDTVPDALRRTAAAHRVTPHMVGLAAFAALLHHWSGVDDLVVGSAFAGRTDPESEDAIGCFVNLLPVRLRVDAGQPFSALLRQTRQATLLAASAQDVPLDSLVARLRPPRTPAHTPLVQASFGVVKPVAPVRCGEVVFDAVELGSDDARLDLTLWLQDRPDGVLARWTYRTDLFRAPTISDLHDRYAALLSAALARPDSAVATLVRA